MPPQQHKKKPERLYFLTEEFFLKYPLRIKFNHLLTAADQDWFTELVITGLYTDQAKIHRLSKLLKDWDNSNDETKITAVKFDICARNEFFTWELKSAFNYVLPYMLPPIITGREEMKDIVELTTDEKKKKDNAFRYAVFSQGLISNKEKLRSILTNQVEIKAIRNKTYKFVLHALFLYRTKFRWDNRSWLNLSLIDNNAQYFCIFILDIGLEAKDKFDFEEKTEALQKFFQHFKTYARNVFKQGPVVYGSDEALRKQKPVPNVYHGKLTPLQILLGGICHELSTPCRYALLELKLFLLHFSFFVRAIIHIGVEEGYIEPEYLYCI